MDPFSPNHRSTDMHLGGGGRTPHVVTRDRMGVVYRGKGAGEAVGGGAKTIVKSRNSHYMADWKNK